jgi:hypothetical protein
MSDRVVWMKVTDILEQTTGSVDFGDVDDYSSPEDFWFAMMSDKAGDTGFGHLVESIMAHGFKPEGAIGWDKGCQMDGHHRLTAAILLCLDEIPTVPEYGAEWYNPDGTKKVVAHYSADEYPIDL